MLYFNADDGVHGYELWVTDGTTGGTNMVKDIFQGTNNLYAGYTFGIFAGLHNGFVTLNNKMYFEAQDSLHGFELWTSDGTTAGTTLVADIWPGRGESEPGYFGGFYNINGTLYFEADDSIHGFELWSSDGTTSGTTLVKDINPGTAVQTPCIIQRRLLMANFILMPLPMPTTTSCTAVMAAQRARMP